MPSQVIQREGALSKQKLLEKLGGGVSLAALDKALAELWSKLPHHPRRLQSQRRIGLGCALPLGSRCRSKKASACRCRRHSSALVSKYLDCVIAIEQSRARNLFRQLHRPLQGEGCRQRIARRPRVELRARQRTAPCCRSRRRKSLSDSGSAVRSVAPASCRLSRGRPDSQCRNAETTVLFESSINTIVAEPNQDPIADASPRPPRACSTWATRAPSGSQPAARLSMVDS